MKSSADLNKEHVGTLSAAMARVHKMLLENEIEILERRQGAPIVAATRLQLLLTDPELDWLREMSRLMAAVDEVFFQKEPVTDEQMQKAHQSVEELLITGTETAFAKKYRSLLGTVPNLMLEHGHLRVALKGKPKGGDFN